MKQDILEDLEFRGLLNQSTDLEALRKRLAQGPCVLYCGFDATADSLHVGNLLPLVCLKRFQIAGHKPIALLGGGTSLIGDPSGKKSERVLNDKKTVSEWVRKIEKQAYGVFSAEPKGEKARVISNGDWLNSLKMIDFIRDVGKHFSIGYMLAKESVKSRLETGISFTEFTYMLLQSYDFFRLYSNYNCELQIGGSDQWGNITAGIDFIKKTAEVEVFGLTIPLIVKSDGNKFGKTESGAIWLDPEKTSPYQFYQFWMNIDDKDVIQFIKYFTFLSKSEIEKIEEEFLQAPEKREAQKILAKEMTILVHGESNWEQAERISTALFKGDIQSLNKKEAKEIFKSVPFENISGKDEINICDFLVLTKVCESKRQAREDVENGAISLNGEIIKDLELKVLRKHRLYGEYFIIRRGKKNYSFAKWD